LTVQYPEDQIHNLNDLKQIPLHSSATANSTQLDAVADIERVEAPTEVDHYQLSRTVDLYVSPRSEDLGSLAQKIDKIIGQEKLPAGVRVEMRGMVQGMRESFKSFSIGLLLAVVLVYLILVAQFKSFVDPFIILLAVPMGITGVLLTLWLTGTTVNVM